MPWGEPEERSKDGIASTLGTILAALYLAGLERPAFAHSKRWPDVCAALRRQNAELSNCVSILGAHGFWEEALILSHPGLLRRGEALLESGRVLTAACDLFPLGWRRLGRAAPPAVWISDPLPSGIGVGIVGSRKPPMSSLRFSREVSAEAVRLGMVVVSGGAPGCDAEAARGASGRLVEILPCGIQTRWGVGSGVRLSVRPPGEAFTTAAAMERNTLLYAYGECSVVCHARFKTGGAWIGASEALRRRLGRLLVWADEASLASRALIALGGMPLKSPVDLERTIKEGHPSQRGLFPS
jgi:predicted Rossmann fold nucleotide-binding protein DprA/Smf involved in DNA uptake